MTIPKKMVMTKEKKRVAKYLANGHTYQETADRFKLAHKTVKSWMAFRDGETEERTFRTFVDKLTLENEMNTKAGILRRVNRAIEVKEDYLEEDKTTMLEWIKELGQIVDESEEKDAAVINIIIDGDEVKVED
ncbi:hypothetical protein GQ473_00170 [archaeon]|nr:hypothetical protein [archaeon]